MTTVTTTDIDIDTAIADFSMVAKYLPQDLSEIEDARGAYKRSDLYARQLNYKVKLLYLGREVLETDYHMGIDRIPGFTQMGVDKVPGWNRLKEVFRSGFAINDHDMKVRRILPELKDVLYCLIRDGEAIDSSFEDWCSDYGCDSDSIKAKGTYDACVDMGLKLQRAIGYAGVEALQRAFQDY